MGKKDIEFKVMGSSEELADYLENLAAGLRKGTLYIEQGTQAVSLSPSEEVTMELSAKTKEEKQKLSLKLSWRTIAKASSGDAALTISAEEPEKNEDGNEAAGGDVEEALTPNVIKEADSAQSDDEKEVTEPSSKKKGSNTKAKKSSASKSKQQKKPRK